MTERLIDSLVTTAALADAFSDVSMVSAMLDFEVALARVQARLGIIPAQAAAHIEAAANPTVFDAAVLAARARESGTIAIPFVERLREQVQAINVQAAGFVHWGATSQDLTDTALIRCLTRARTVLEDDHTRLTVGLRRLSEQHAGSVMLARTLLQPALPITFGLKAAGWFASVRRSGQRLMEAFTQAAVLQFGGASGTLAALGTTGPAVAAALARELALTDPGASWHAHRDRLGSLVAACGVYTAVVGKIARDVALLMQHEVGETAEPGGPSSSMPQKRNPSGCAVALAAATRVPGLVAGFLFGMVQEHERGLGGWHAEASTIADVVQATGSALSAVAGVVDHLAVDPDRMRANIGNTNGAVFAERALMKLTPEIGRAAALARVAAAVEEARSGRRTLPEALGDSELERLEPYLESADACRRRLLEDE